MPVQRALLDPRTALGLEIGGPSDIFCADNLLPLYARAACIDNCTFAGDTQWAQGHVEGPTFVFDQAKKPGHQYIREATDLCGVMDESYDFVCSAHTLE